MPSEFPWYWTEGTQNLWQRLRQRGAFHFVLVRGVTARGGIMFLGFFALWDVIGFRPRTLASTAELVGLCLAFGFGWGVFVWCTSEFFFRRHRERQS